MFVLNNPNSLLNCQNLWIISNRYITSAEVMGRKKELINETDPVEPFGILRHKR